MAAKELVTSIYIHRPGGYVGITSGETYISQVNESATKVKLMGDKSPKSNRKKQAQQQAKNAAVSNKKKQAIADKQSSFKSK